MRSAMRGEFSLLNEFVTADEHRAILGEIDEHHSRWRKTEGSAGLGPRYSVIGGDVIATSLPTVQALAERVRLALETFAGQPLAAFSDPVRRMRVQCYENEREGFRWHFDGHAFAAVVTLENENGGVTQIVSERISRIARPLFYLSYFFPRLASLLPHESVEGSPRDVLLLRGRRNLHRGHTRRNTGRRTVLVFAYDPPGVAPTRFRNWVARTLNY
jgi:hypothetical protein